MSPVGRLGIAMDVGVVEAGGAAAGRGGSWLATLASATSSSESASASGSESSSVPLEEAARVPALHDDEG